MTNEDTLDSLADSSPRVQQALERVRDEARARPLVALGIATGLGFVLGKGLPRLGLLGLGLTGGVVGYGLLRMMRARADAEMGASEDSPESDASDEDAGSGDASAENDDAPTPRHHRNRSRKASAPKMPQV